MRILYYSRPSFVDNDILLVKALHDLGNEVCFVIKIAEPHKKSPMFSIHNINKKTGIISALCYKELEWINNFVKCNFNVLNIPNFKAKHLNFKSYVSLVNLVKSFKPEVIHYIGNPEDLTDLLFLSKYRKKAVLTIHDPIPHSGENNKKVYYLNKISLKLVSKIILLNDNQTELFLQRYSLPQKKVFISKLGYFEWIKQLDINKSSKAPYLLFYGRISPYKGLEYLLEALTDLKRNIPDLKAIIAGNGKYHFDISCYQSLDYIKFINRYIETKELAELIYNSSFVICPYIDATQSGVVNTVLALEKPIIVTNVGALAENIVNEENGLIIPPKSVNAIKESISKLWGNNDLLNYMHLSIKNKSKADVSWKNIAKRTINIYKY